MINEVFFHRHDSNLPNNLTELFQCYQQEGIKKYIQNCGQKAQLIELDGLFIPVVVNSEEPLTMYLSSPTDYYLNYSADFVNSIQRKKIRYPLLALISCLRWFFKCSQIERVVYLNNYLLPNNPEITLTVEQLESLVRYIKTNFPSHAIFMKGINVNLQHFSSLKILSKQIYKWDFSVTARQGKKAVKIRKTLKSDKKLTLNKTIVFEALTLINDNIACRLQYLYQRVYIDTYSSYSADYTKDWFKMLSLSNCGLQVFIARYNGEIQGFISYYETESMIYSGLVGHADQQGELGIYRACIYKMIEIATQKRKTLHLSSGAGEFKRRRGAEPEMEYDNVIIDHLGLKQKIGWKLLQKTYNSLGSLVMKNQKV